MPFGRRARQFARHSRSTHFQPAAIQSGGVKRISADLSAGAEIEPPIERSVVLPGSPNICRVMSLQSRCQSRGSDIESQPRLIAWELKLDFD
jgi:hypothetical protein